MVVQNNFQERETASELFENLGVVFKLIKKMDFQSQYQLTWITPILLFIKHFYKTTNQSQQMRKY